MPTDNNITRFLRAFLASAQDVENAASQVFLGFNLDDAVGVQLDVIGALVGQPRNGMSDTDYRRFCRARIKVNRSDGNTDDLIEIAKLILNITATGNIFVRCIENASFILEVRDLPVDSATAFALQQLLCAATSGGVRIVIVYSPRALSGVFRFDSGLGLDQGHLAAAIDATSTVE